MFGGRRSPAVLLPFGDMMMVLFIASLVASIAAVIFLGQKEKQLRENETKFAESQKKCNEIIGGLKANAECEIGNNLLQDLEDCLTKKERKVTKHGCGLVINDAVYFEHGLTELRPDGYELSRAIGECMVENRNKIISTQALDSIVIEGHADCTANEGTYFEKIQRENKRAGERAFNMYIEVVKTVGLRMGDLQNCETRKLLARITTQTFGFLRPTVNSKCMRMGCMAEYREECAPDRRVELRLNSAFTKVKPNWEITCETN